VEAGRRLEKEKGASMNTPRKNEKKTDKQKKSPPGGKKGKEEKTGVKGGRE